MMEENTRAADETKGARRASEEKSAVATEQVKRWNARRKQEVVMRLMRGEPVDKVSREVGIEIYRLEEWRSRALAGMENALRERGNNDPVVAELRAAQRCIGELTMENSLLRERVKKKRSDGKGGL